MLISNTIMEQYSGYRINLFCIPKVIKQFNKIIHFSHKRHVCNIIKKTLSISKSANDKYIVCYALFGCNY